MSININEMVIKDDQTRLANEVCRNEDGEDGEPRQCGDTNLGI